MKTIKYFAIALAALLTTACQKDWDAPTVTPSDVFGNKNITESNLITIQQLKEKFPDQLMTSTNREAFVEVTEPLQIKGYITCNDIEGNMYKEISIQDETSAISISINQSGLFGYMPLGAEIIVELKGLYVGNYRYHPFIGTPYTDDKKQTYVSRMNEKLWQQHFTYTGKTKKREEMVPEVFADGEQKTTWSLDKDAGKLGVLKNVTFKNGSYYDSTKKASVSVVFNADAKYADAKYNNSVSWYFNEQPTSVMLYNSNYAKFAGNLLPQGKVNITGILKRYNNNWEFIIRDAADVELVK